MQAVPTSAGCGVIQRQLQVVVAEEPIESRPRCTAPLDVTGYTVRLQASRNRACGFERLLIETRLLTTPAIEALRADRNKVTGGFTPLHFQQPVQGFQADGNHPVVRASGTYKQ